MVFVKITRLYVIFFLVCWMIHIHTKAQCLYFTYFAISMNLKIELYNTMDPTWTGKMGDHFPVRESQGILPKYLKIRKF